MSVVLYLIVVLILLVASAATVGAAGAKADALRQRDLVMEFSDERQHALLGRSVEWSARLVSGGWMLIGFGHFVIFGLALSVDPLRWGWEQRPMPALLAALGLTAAAAVLIFSRMTLRKTCQAVGQYDAILAGEESDRTSRADSPQTA